REAISSRRRRRLCTRLRVDALDPDCFRANEAKKWRRRSDSMNWIGLRRKCRQHCETTSDLATDNVDTTLAHPNMSGQTTPLVRRGAVIKHRRYAASSQHQLCGKTLLKAHGAPRHPACGGDDCPTYPLHLFLSCLLRQLRSTNGTCCQTPDLPEGQHSDAEPGDRQPKRSLDQQQSIALRQPKKFLH